MRTPSPPWFRRRNYPHFDRPVGVKRASRLVSAPARVAVHPFYPFLRFTIKERRYKRKKRKTVVKEREVMYAGHLDSQVFSYYSHLLGELYEDELARLGIGECPVAYRKLGRKCNIHFARDAFDVVQARGKGAAIAADVSDFFGTMTHARIKEKWCRILGEKRLPADHFSVFKAITCYAYVDLHRLPTALGLSKTAFRNHRGRYCAASDFRTKVRGTGIVKRNSKEHGIPQGSPISALLSNVYMLDFDKSMADLAAAKGAFYRRYSDDILLVCPSEQVEFFRSEIVKRLKDEALDANPDKEQVSMFETDTDGRQTVRPPLQYLGFEYDGREVRIRSRTLARQKQRARSAVVAAAASAKKHGSPRIRRKKVYSLHSHLKNVSSRRKTGRRSASNFYTYVRRSAEAFGSDSVKKQLRPHWPWLNRLLQEYEEGLS
jgi:hypothetical protein